MALTEDVMELVRVLDEEGFGALAGEILLALNVGRSPVDTELDGSISVLIDELASRRTIPIQPEEQLDEALHILRLQMIEPARRLAEAERIAAKLSGHEQVAIRFDDEASFVGETQAKSGEPGDQSIAEKLDDLMGRILLSQRRP